MIAYVNAYHTGSHKGFYQGWSSRSAYDFALIDFPGRHWKWRMRHSAWSAAQRIAVMATPPDAIVVTDMCNAAELRGHLPARLRAVPLVLYFHEHQLAYPSEGAQRERDDHFALTNMMGALAADAVWCNSRHLIESMVHGLRGLLRRMPSPRLVEAAETIGERAVVLPPGVDGALFDIERGADGRHASRRGGALRVLWNARWEHDKGVDVVAEALVHAAEDGAHFVCDLVGPATAAGAGVMQGVRTALGDRVARFGRQEDEAYRAALAEADVVVSAARHEFFGIAVVEAVAAGARALVPRDLAYPEVLSDAAPIWHTGDATGLAGAITACAAKLGKGGVWDGDADRGRRGVRRYAWDARARSLDEAIAGVVG